MSTTPAAQSAAPAAGDLLDVVALDRTGTLVRSDGTLVRYYELIPQNPDVLAEDQQEVMIDGLGRALGALRAGETLQIYAVAAPIQLPELLTQLKQRLTDCLDSQPADRASAYRELAGRLRADAAPPHDRQCRRPAADLPDRPVLTRERQRPGRLEEPAPRRPPDQSSRRGLPRSDGARPGVPAGRGARRQRLPRARSARVHRDPARGRGGCRADLPAAEPVDDHARADPATADHRRARRDRRRRRSSRGRAAAPRASSPTRRSASPTAGRSRSRKTSSRRSTSRRSPRRHRSAGRSRR